MDRLQYHGLIAAVFLALGLLIYSSSLGNGFVDFDDGSLITENSIVRESSLRSIGRAFLAFDPELYVPLTTLSYKLNFMLHGLAPFGYHAGNLLLHIGNALLVTWFIILLVGRTQELAAARFIGIIAGLLFLVHPIHAEAVAWASARKDVLSATFFLAALIAYLFSLRTEKPHTARWGYSACLLLFVFGLLAKVTIVLLPLLLLLLDWYQRRKMDQRAFRGKIPFLLASALFLIIAFEGKAGRMHASSLLFEKFLIACRTITFSLQKLLVPQGLSVLYPYTDPITLAAPDLLLSVLVFITLSIGVLFIAKKTKVPLFAWGFFLLTLIPSLGGITREHNAVADFYLGSDRYVYLPSIAFFFLIAIGFSKLWKRYRNLTIAAVLLLTTTLAALSFKQSHVWENTETLFQNVLAHYPDSHVAHTKIGQILAERGDSEGTLAAFQASVVIRPNATAYYQIGVLMLQTGDTERAKAAFREAVAASPMDTPSYLALASLLASEEKREEAISVLQKLFREPTSLREGREEARRLLETLLRES